LRLKRYLKIGSFCYNGDMFDIPFNFILINPAVDIVLFIFVSYIFLTKWYKELLKSNPNKIYLVDFKVSIIFLILGYLNYVGKEIEFFGFQLNWWIFIIAIQLFVEGFFAIIFWKYIREYFRGSKIK